MSRTKNGAVRCDWCGRLTRDRDCHYLKPDGKTYGRIVQPEWERFPDGRTDVEGVASTNDICEECAAKQCPFCGGNRIVMIVPGAGEHWPEVLSGRCKDCGKRWPEDWS